MANLYALLVGINCYLPNQLSNGLYYKSLLGCVQDIRLVEDFLRTRLNVTEDRLLKLTSSSNSAGEPLEPPQQWPTYENIVNGFKQLEQRTQAGDLVYIHYSGHGGRTPTTPEFLNLKGPEGLDEVLVPMDLGNSEGRYLRDTELQHLLKALVKKGVILTVVLDSCHAGGATRVAEPLVVPELNGVGVRGTGQIDTTLRPLNSLAGSPEELLKSWQSVSHAGARTLHTASSWLLEPEGYVLVAACRANEYANEVCFEGSEKNGALSYWLVDSLKQMGPGFTYRMLHERILAKVHGQFAEQTPQLQGEGDRLIFSTDEVASQHAVTVLNVNPNQTMVLNSGQAHGVRRGARFSVYPIDETDFHEVATRLAVVEIAQAGAVNSTARILTQFSSQAVEPGCRAILLDMGSVRLRRRVRLVNSGKSSAEREPDLALKNVARVLERQADAFIVPAGNDESADYIATVNDAHEYVICDAGGQAIPNLRPPIRVTEVDAALRLTGRLTHLARYANVRALANNDTQSSLAVDLIVELAGLPPDYEAGDPVEPQSLAVGGHTHSLKDGEWILMRIRNNHAASINITVLNLQSDWSISQIYPARAGAFETLDLGREVLLPLRVSLPEGYPCGTDIVKVFGTLDTTSFRWLELPALDQPVLSNHLRGIPSTSLDRFLTAFSSTDSGARKVEISTIANMEWVAHQVEVEIRKPAGRLTCA